MTAPLSAYLIVLPLVFLASALDAVGGGGGLISLPAYMVAGLPPALASGSNKLSASVGSLTAAIRYARGGKVMPLPALLAVAGAIPGAFLGAELLAATSEAVMRAVLLVVMPVMAAVLVVKRKSPERAYPVTGARLALCFLTGLLCGAYDGFCGPGTGTLLIMGFVWIVGMETVTASGSAKVVNLASNVGALAAHMLNGNILYALAVPAMACGALGGYVGSVLAIRRGAKLVRAVMLCMMLALFIKLAVDYL